MRNKLAIIIDNTCLSILAGVVAYSWCQFYTHSIKISILAALIMVATSILLCWIITKQSLKKRNINKQTKNNINRIYQKLIFCSNKEQLLWLKQSIIQNQPAQMHTSFFWFKNCIIYNALLTENFNKDNLCIVLREIAQYYAPKDLDNITILCSNANNNLKHYINALNIKIDILNSENAIIKYQLKEQDLNCFIHEIKPIKNYKFFIEYNLITGTSKILFNARFNTFNIKFFRFIQNILSNIWHNPFNTCNHNIFKTD